MLYLIEAEGHSVLRTPEKMESNQTGLLNTHACPPSLHTHTLSNTRHRRGVAQDLLLVKYPHFHTRCSKLSSHGSGSCCAGEVTEKLVSSCSSAHNHITLFLRLISSFLQQKGRAGYLIHTSSGDQCEHLSICACNPSTSKTNYKNQFQILF